MRCYGLGNDRLFNVNNVGCCASNHLFNSYGHGYGYGGSSVGAGIIAIAILILIALGVIF